ncbi:MAG: hypothetical protein KUG69_01800 [Marinosulfonomonas sp.]|nr:hypothetical protein [Marinosulfonomonas sp.]
MIAGPGHNNGPTMEPGQAWRKHCWKKARADLLPSLPIEILRGRVRRAKELGLEYKTYASVRASTGRDVVGFLFSSNALRAFVKAPGLSAERRETLDGLIDCARVAVVSKPLTPAQFLAVNPDVFDAAQTAPNIWQNWPQSREVIQSALRGDRLPADGILLIGDGELEREWSTAGKLAGYLGSERFFTGATP